MIILVIVLLIPSRFVMPRCSCFLHYSRHCFRQNLEPGLKGPKRETECTTENCFSTDQTMHCPPARNRYHSDSRLKPENRSTLGCGSFHCFEDCCLTELDLHQGLGS
jgi:hypothetical protein